MVTPDCTHNFDRQTWLIFEFQKICLGKGTQEDRVNEPLSEVDVQGMNIGRFQLFSTLFKIF